MQGEVGSFYSLNSFIVKGRVPWQLRYLTVESLMGRSYDEPFTLYGLLAESVEVADDRSWVEFTLRPEAEFSDGSPVTVEDVLWSYETLGTVGHPRYLGAWTKVASSEATGERSVRFTFTERDDERWRLRVAWRRGSEPRIVPVDAQPEPAAPEPCGEA